MLLSAGLSGYSTPRSRREHGDRDAMMNQSGRGEMKSWISAADRVLRTSAGERRWWPVLGAIAAIALVVSLLLPGSRHQWALSIFRQPARYTTLAFNDAGDLPATAITDSPVPISFTLANQQGRTLTYTYVVRQSDPPPLNITQTMATASRTLGPGRTWTVSIDVRPTCGLSPCRIQVSVPGHPEKIDFLVILKAAVHKRHASKSSQSASRHHARRT
jgi:hypothetical protein